MMMKIVLESVTDRALAADITKFGANLSARGSECAQLVCRSPESCDKSTSSHVQPAAYNRPAKRWTVR